MSDPPPSERPPQRLVHGRVLLAIVAGGTFLTPINSLERLKGDREGFHAIRINDQWRIVFRWEADGVTRVEVTDYH